MRKELTEKDRYTLELCLKRGDNVASISSLLCFHPKTILREIVNGTVTLLDTNLLEYSCYKANYAQGIHDASVCNRGCHPKKVSDSLLVHNGYITNI